MGGIQIDLCISKRHFGAAIEHEVFKLSTNQGETALKAGVAEEGMLLHLKAGEIGFFSGIKEFGLIKNQHAPKGRLSEIHRALKNSAFERGALHYPKIVKTGHFLRVVKLGAIGVEFAADIGAA